MGQGSYNLSLESFLRDDAESIARLLAQGRIRADERDILDASLLCCAARLGAARCVAVLAAASRDPMAVDGNRYTPMMVAAQRGHLAAALAMMPWADERQTLWARNAALGGEAPEIAPAIMAAWDAKLLGDSVRDGAPSTPGSALRL